jgi:hypothetical protein
VPLRAHQLPSTPSDFGRRIAALERQLRELRGAQPLQSTSIGGTTISQGADGGMEFGGAVTVDGDLTVQGTLSAPPTDPGLLNVMAAPYKATGDGVTDDTAAIQAALNDAASAGWGYASRQVYLPARFYLVGPLTIPHGVTLRGAGMRSTTLIASAGIPDGSYLLRNILPYNAVQSYDRIPIWVSWMLMIFVGGTVLRILIGPAMHIIALVLFNA